MTYLPLNRTEFQALSGRIDKVWVFFVLLLVAIGITVPAEFPGIVGDTISALGHTGIFIAFAVLAVAWLKATGAETILAKAFTGNETRMIVMAALAGGLSPFCSCEVIPFIAAMLALGVPVSAVMAFWLASPIMDPPMFFITMGALGLPFALAKTSAAVFMGLFGGFGVRALAPTGILADPLKARPKKSCGCGSDATFKGKPVWKFWTDADRRMAFRETAIENAGFLIKWLALAYLIEALMIRYVPAELIGGWLGGDGLQPVILGALVGGPAYLNGYAAAPLLAGLIEQGMSQGAALSFALAGGVSCIPAALAVWALVKPKIFALYLGFAFAGSVIAGLVWAGLN